MKSFARKGIALIILCCVFVSLFACGENNENVDNTQSSNVALEVLSTEKINFVTDDNKAAFRIVRPDDADEGLGSMVGNLFKKYKELHGPTPKQVTDSENGDGVREILVGNCNRESTKKAQQLLKSVGTGKDSDFIICSIDDDIVILGGCNASLMEACDYFIANILPKEHPNGIYSYQEGHGETMTVCGITELSKFNVVRPIYNVSYLTQCETEKVCKYLYEKTGYNLSIVNDNVSKQNPDTTKQGGVLNQTDVSEYEIIIGNCNRDGVKTWLSESTYEIRIEDKKIFLNGGSPYATAMAVSEFLKLLENNAVIDKSMTVANGDYSKVSANYDPKTYYKPVWWDEFDGDEIDTAKWTVAWNERGGTATDGKISYRGNPELKNNYVKDGKLYIEAIKTDTAYYGGMLRTIDTMEFQYGYLEISDQHPNGNGFWTACWTLSKQNPEDLWFSETDIDESFGDGYMIKDNLWAWPTALGRQQLGLNNGRSDVIRDHDEINTADPRGFWMDFHTYGLEWVDNQTVRIIIDGNVWRETKLEEDGLKDAYSKYMYIQISMATAFNSKGEPTDDEWKWQNTNKFIVDYIYLYQLQGNGLKLH